VVLALCSVLCRCFPQACIAAGGRVAGRPRACVWVHRLTLAMSPDRFKLCHQPQAVLDVRCRRREDVVEWSGCRSDSRVLKGAAASYHGRLADVTRPFG